LERRHFTGRETTLEELQQRLFIQANTQILALFGLSGIGKTQVALQFAHWVKKKRPEFSIFWVSAFSLQSFEQACLQIVRKVGIQQPSDDANESAMELVHTYLRSNAAGKWLFIVDNADDQDLLFTELYQFIPTSENGITLLTTCTLQVAVTFATKDIVKLEKMTLVEGKAFIAKIVREDLLCEESTTQLLEELDYLPLAIKQAAFYVNYTETTVSQYLEIMQKTEKNRADLASRTFRDCTRYSSKENAITKTFTISFERIKNSDPDAAELLEFLSCIEPKAIPRSMLPTLKAEENTVFAIGILCGYAFLTKRDDGKEFDMHCLVQLSTWLWVEKAGHAQHVIQKVVQHMDECFPSDENYNYEKCRAYLPHAIQVIRRDESKSTSERYSLLIKVGDFVSTVGREKEALGFFEDASMWHESQHNEEHPDRQFSDHALANAYRSDGQIKRAVQILERVVAARQRRTADKADRSLLAYQYALAMAYKSARQIRLSLEVLNHVVEIQNATLAEENPDLLSSQHALANAYRSDGQIKLAVQILEHVVKIREDTLDKEDHDLLSSQQALAKSYKADGQIERAVEILQHVVTIRRKTLGDEAPFLLLSERALAKAYKSAGDIKLAVQRLEHVVNVHNERTLDKEDRDLLSSKHSLAMAYRSDGQIPLAVKMLEEVVTMYKKTLDKENPHLLSCQHALGKTYLMNKQIKEAMQTLEHVVVLRGNTLDKEDRRLLSSQRLLAMVYKSDGQVELAVQKLEHVVAVHKTVHGEEDPDGLASQKALVKTKRKLKKPKKLQAI
jgi:tetratricopeptide (TPR) repeat protein